MSHEEPHSWVELSEQIQQEILSSILALVKNERKRRSLWNKFLRFVSRFKISKCFCGPGGVGCECEVKPPSPILPQRVRIRRSPSGNRVETENEAKVERVVQETEI